MGHRSSLRVTRWRDIRFANASGCAFRFSLSDVPSAQKFQMNVQAEGAGERLSDPPGTGIRWNEDNPDLQPVRLPWMDEGSHQLNRSAPFRRIQDRIIHHA